MKESLPIIGFTSLILFYLAIFDANMSAALMGAMYYAFFWYIIRKEMRRTPA